MVTYGKVDEYVLGQDWCEYTERLEQYFAANEITDAGKQKNILLTACGSQTYTMIRNLCSPDKPSDKSFADLKELVKNHVNPKPLVIAERFKFYQRCQKGDESVNEFLAQLRRLSQHCDFGDFLKETLRDRFVCGLKSNHMQRKLLTEVDLTLEKALKIASGMEVADKEAEELKNVTENLSVKSEIRKVERTWRFSPQKCSGNVKKPCNRCGKEGHPAEKCFYRNAKCHKCKQRGHISRQCQKRSQAQDFAENKPAVIKKRDAAVSHVEEKAIWPVLNTNTKKAVLNGPIMIPLKIENCDVELELDTGSPVSLIPETMYNKYFKYMSLQDADVELTSYTKEDIPVLGKLMVFVKYKSHSARLPLRVVKGNGAALLGRNWLAELQLGLEEACINRCAPKLTLDNILKKYTVFDGTLGKIEGITAKLRVKKDATPKFFKPRPVAYALRDKIARELKRLESIGAIEKVETSEWASPIVPVMKPDGSVRICGDFKVTINPVLEVPEYPMPRAEDLFSKLNGGEKFSKCDLSEAYQQVELDSESRKYVTINTHLGLWRYKRLPYGVASSPAIFQETMEKILQGFEKVGCILDDLIVTEKDDESHLKLLDQLLHRLDSFGVKLKASKCFFLQPSVQYFSFIVDSEGIHPSPEKVNAIVNIPEPTNVKELQSLLGIVNYYRKFIPDMSTLLAPLTRLLKQSVKWNWDLYCRKAFRKLKNVLVSSEVLIHYDPEKPLILATDASNVGLGAVISHILPNGAEKPIAYASRTLTRAEKNYSQIEKEALAIVYGVKKFHVYLFGRKFSLLTDHQPLTMLLSPKRGIPVLAATRIQRWALKLAAYTYDIQYRSTKKNGNADTLSRLPLKSETESSNDDEVSVMHLAQIEKLPLTTAKLRRATEVDKKLSKVLLHTVNGWPAKEEVATELIPFYRRKDEITVEEGCLLRGLRVIIPEKLVSDILKLLHENHPGMVRMKSLARLHVWFPNIDERIEETVRNCSNCQEMRSMPSAAPGNPWIWPSRPWQRIHVDYAYYMNSNFLVVVDAHSKWPEVLKMSSTTAESTICALRYLFSSFGICEELVSDNATVFTSVEFSNFLKSNGVKHILSSPYHPSSNGEAERNVRTFKTALKTVQNMPGSLNEKLASFLLSYRTTPHSTTKCTPAELFMKRRLRTRLDLMKPDLSKSVQKRTTPVQKRIRDLDVGCKVFVRDYRHPSKKWVHGTILKKLGPVTYRVKVGSKVWKRHIDQMLGMSNSSCEVSERNAEDYYEYGDMSISDSIVPEVGGNEDNGLSTEDAAVARRYPSRLRGPPRRLIESM